ncbi:MAG TPA: hypothetical protein VIF09_04130 [Polyangiaceae bacterium]
MLFSCLLACGACGSSPSPAAGSTPPGDDAGVPGDDAAGSGDDAGNGQLGNDVDPSACDGQGGAPTIPAGFPQLGGRCRAHFTFHEDDIDTTNQFATVSSDHDFAGSRGARPLTTTGFTGYDLGVTYKTDIGGGIPIAFFLPALSPAVYVRRDAAEVLTGDIGGVTSYDSQYGCGGVRIQVVGRTSDAVWGTFTSDGYDPGALEDSHVTNGLFSAAIESTPSAMEFAAPCGLQCGTPSPYSCAGDAVPCSTAADCPAPPSACVVVTCKLLDLWSGGPGYCIETPTDGQCGSQQRCTYQQGCVPG